MRGAMVDIIERGAALPESPALDRLFFGLAARIGLPGREKAAMLADFRAAALHFVLPRFPFFATRVRRGVFWHYIDAAKRRFEVRPET